MSMPVQLLALALAGALGTLARYGLSVAIDSRLLHQAKHPIYGTLLVNALGCLLFGLILAYLTARAMDDHPMRLILLTGFMGAFTTFSTYAYLTSDLAAKQQWFLAGGHLVAHNAIGIMLFITGTAIGHRLVA
ncbi:MAG: fluoride efflux transporter FluC [Phycisphaeraceae bacterium]